MTITMLVIGSLALIVLFSYVGSQKTLFEGYENAHGDKKVMKGCSPPSRPYGNCKDKIYVTTSDKDKPEVWSVCPYECDTGDSDDVSVCKHDKQCASTDAKTGKFNNGCIIRLHLDHKNIRGATYFSSRAEMEKALGYKICSTKPNKKRQSGNFKPRPQPQQRPPTPSHQTNIGPDGDGTGAGPHGTRMFEHHRKGPGYPNAHGGAYDADCYPEPPRHHTGRHPGLPYSQPPPPHIPPHAPPHKRHDENHHHEHDKPRYRCECSGN